VKAKEGDTVVVHYTGSLKDGTVFDSSVSKAPFEFTIGKRMAIAGFEQGIIGMQVGEKKKVSIRPVQAYGKYRKELNVKIERAKIPPKINPEIGMVIQIKAKSGQLIDVVVKELDGDFVTLDGNHPLAGHELTFEIELIKIKEK